MGFLEKPYLPKNETDLFVADCRAEDFLDGFSYVPSYTCSKIMKEVSSHPDMTICHLGGNKIVAEKSSFNYYEKILKPYGFNIIKGESNLNKTYPADIAFNCVILNGKLFHRIKYTDPAIIREAEKIGLELIDVRQGYTKCSTLIIDESSVITGDCGLHKKYTENGIKSLLISNETVSLDGFENGFIGGAGGLISPNKLAFFGNIEKHPQYRIISDFLNERNISAITLKERNIYDFGSIIPLKEIDY